MPYPLDCEELIIITFIALLILTSRDIYFIQICAHIFLCMSFLYLQGGYISPRLSFSRPERRGVYRYAGSYWGAAVVFACGYVCEQGTITVQEGYLGTPVILRILYAFVQGLEMPHVVTCLGGYVSRPWTARPTLSVYVYPGMLTLPCIADLRVACIISTALYSGLTCTFCVCVTCSRSVSNLSEPFGQIFFRCHHMSALHTNRRV